MGRLAAGCTGLLLLALLGCGTVYTYEGKTATAWAKDLKSDDSSVRMKAIESLAKITEHDPRVAEQLALGLEDPSASNRITTVKLLGGLGAKAQGALRALEKCAANDKEDYIRRDAQKAIAEIQGATAAPTGV